MLYKTHLTTSLAVTLPIMAATDTLTAGTLVALGLGVSFPDIDEPHSWIGCRTRGISDLINKIFGHRGITHSLAGVILVFLTVVLMVSLTNFKAIIGLYFVFGYLLHVLEDSFSKSGVKWLTPLSEQKFQSGGGIVYYKTGSLVENFILMGSVAILVFEVSVLDFTSIQLVNGNLIQSISSFFNEIKASIKL